MNGGGEPNGTSAPKETVGKFILRVTNPFELETEGLGLLIARRMTMKGIGVFHERLKSLDGVEDPVLVRTYMGCVSGLPAQDAEKLPEPLTEDEVSRLSDDDVVAFARAYLDHIAKAAEISQPLTQMAEFIRKERAQQNEDTKQLAETIKSALKVSSTADLMKQWQGLSGNIQGSVSSIQDELAKVLGPAAAMRLSIADAVRDLQEDRRRSIAGVFDNAQKEAFNAIKRATDFDPIIKRTTNFDRTMSIDPIGASYHFRAPVTPPENETPLGRTALAVEQLCAAGQRMEDAMGVVVTQAGNVSEQMGQVLGKIEHEARKSQKATTLALLVGGLSLFVSAVAFVASLYFSRVGFAADRAEAKASDAASAKVVEQLEAQNRLSRQLVDEQRKARPAPTPSTVQPASAARPARRRSPAAN